MKAYQAYANGASVTRDTPQSAAVAFFDTFPNKRKCDVIEGNTDGAFFTIRFGRVSEGDWPQSWKGVTKKTATGLPT